MGDMRIRVLFTRTEKQEQLLKMIQEAVPEERGRVFLPMREYWRRDIRQLDVKPMFPGYLFFRTDMDADEIHDLLKLIRYRMGSFVRELGAERLRIYEEEETEFLSDLTPEEKFFFDTILDQDGVERMSYGYCDPKAVVMEGPLKTLSDKIIRRDRHERVAWLNVTFRNQKVVAGLTILPKGHYYPDGVDRIGFLEDGTEVDLTDLKNRMTAGQTACRSRT